MSIKLPLAVILQSADDGLTLREVISSLPVDPGALVAIALIAGFAFIVIRFGTRGQGQRPDPPTAAPPPKPRQRRRTRG